MVNEREGQASGGWLEIAAYGLGTAGSQQGRCGGEDVQQNASMLLHETTSTPSLDR